MPRYAAVDIGSNSVRMMVAEVAGGRTTILAQDRQVTRLGSGVFQDGRIAPEATRFVCDQLERMAETFKTYELAGVRAVATSAVRDASNQQEFLQRAQAALGAPIEIISGQEEARLVHLGVESRQPEKTLRTLIIDVGGGSTEYIVNDRGNFASPFSRPLGAVRLTTAFLKHDPPSTLELRQMNDYILEKLVIPARKIQPPLDRTIATSATAAAIVCAVNGIPRSRREEADQMTATQARIRELYEQLIALDVAGRRNLVGIGPRRAELIIAGTAVFLRSLEVFHQDALFYSVAGVRDGVIADLAARGVGRELSQLNQEQRAVVEEMAARYGVQPQHARKVACLAHQLFEAMQPLHGLPQVYGKLLEAAGYLHDLGHFVSNTGHHKHSQYLVWNSDMPGFTDAERHVIAALCRYHRKTAPSARHPFFSTIVPEQQRAVILLTPLLRLADSLDRGHGQSVESVAVRLGENQALIELHEARNTELELWAAEKAADLFRATYNIPLVFSRSAILPANK
ncbi:MAG: Ppx/GppA family phosphatase [Acidobacteriaceae bacterium]|nr:Ppx/GppA family phosphatase [Acidobacteriaceae bacterium]